MPASQNALWTYRCFLWGGVLCLLIGLGVFYRRANALQTWKTTQGRVLESKVVPPYNPKDDQQTYSPEVTVSYSAGSREFTRKLKDWSSSSNYQGRLKVIARYPAGASVEVLYNPSDPSSAHIEAGYTLPFFRIPVFLTLFGLFFAGLGLFIGRLTPAKR